MASNKETWSERTGVATTRLGKLKRTASVYVSTFVMSDSGKHSHVFSMSFIPSNDVTNPAYAHQHEISQPLSTTIDRIQEPNLIRPTYSWLAAHSV